MANLAPLRKAMIVIAVSKYNGLPDLPGTITSANRIAEWAASEGVARNYTVLKITDEDWINAAGTLQQGKPVTRDRLENEIRPFIGGNIWDRVVVYFAGHGMMGTGLNDFWLLHNALNDYAEGVNFLVFKTLMERQGIGALGATMGLEAGQASYIVDACRTVEGNLAGFLGSAILMNTSKPVPLETDLFLSTVQGSHAFQPNATKDQKAFCLFSAALSDALEGKVPEVIKTKDHPHAPVITSGTLARWIRKELPKRAKTYGEVLEADPRAGFIDENDFYDVIEEAVPPAEPEPVEEAPASSKPEPYDDDASAVDDDDTAPAAPSDEAAPVEEVDDADGGFDFTEFLTGSDMFEDLVHASELSAGGPPRYSEEDSVDLGTGDTRIVRDGPEPELESADAAAAYPLLLAKELADGIVSIEGYRSVAVPSHTKNYVERVDGRMNYAPISERRGSQPIFVQNRQTGSWTLVPAFHSYSKSVVLADFPEDVFLVDQVGLLPQPDLSLTRFGAMQPARMAYAMELADNIRPGKAFYPNNANRAGYLYFLASDRPNALRTAHYMAELDALSFDLALVASQSIYWKRDEQEGWLAFANLGEVRAFDGFGSDRPAFTKTAFGARKDVALTSLFPIYRQGWSLLPLYEFDTMPAILLEVASQITGQGASVLPEKALRQLAEFFQYHIINFGESDDEAADIHSRD